MNLKFDCYFTSASDGERGSDFDRLQSLQLAALTDRISKLIGRPLQTAPIAHDTPWDAMADYIKNSATLIFFQSDHSLRNEWCIKEASQWIAANSRDGIFCVQSEPLRRGGHPLLAGTHTYDLTTDLGYAAAEISLRKQFYGSMPFFSAVDRLARDITAALEQRGRINRMPRGINAPQGRKLRVFLSHASEDKPTVRALHSYLKENGFDPWLDVIFPRFGGHPC